MIHIPAENTCPSDTFDVEDIDAFIDTFDVDDIDEYMKAIKRATSRSTCRWRTITAIPISLFHMLKRLVNYVLHIIAIIINKLVTLLMEIINATVAYAYNSSITPKQAISGLAIMLIIITFIRYTSLSFGSDDGIGTLILQSIMNFIHNVFQFIKGIFNPDTKEDSESEHTPDSDDTNTNTACSDGHVSNNGECSDGHDELYHDVYDDVDHHQPDDVDSSISNDLHNNGDIFHNECSSCSHDDYGVHDVHDVQDDQPLEHPCNCSDSHEVSSADNSSLLDEDENDFL